MWYFEDDIFWSPEGLSFSVNQLRGTFFLEQLLDAYKQQRQLVLLF